MQHPLAEANGYDEQGWKAFVTIYVSNNKIVTVEFNATNPSGLLKSWDVEYMRRMKAQIGTYPNKYTRAYAAALLNKQNPADVPAEPGAQKYHLRFQQLAAAAIAQAKAGNKTLVLVDMPNYKPRTNTQPTPQLP